MLKTRLLPSAIVAISLISPEAFASSELQQMRATLEEMQKILLQQQARIEQLEKQSAGQPAPARLTLAALAKETPTANPAPVPAAPDVPAVPASPASPPPPALATFYGRLDIFGEANWGGSKGSRLAMESGGMNGSRLGVKGGRNLTSDVKIIYQLETGFFSNNGRLAQNSDGNTRLFGRQAYIGVEGRLGKLTAGRQYSPYFMETIRFDSFENGYGSATTDLNVNPGPTRYDNALIYTTPTYRGLTSTNMLALGGKTGETGQNALGLALNYTEGPTSLGVAYLYDDHNTSSTKTSKYAFAGASYQLGKVKLMGGVAGINISPDQAISSQWRSWMIGTRIDVTSSGQLWLNYGEGQSRDAVIDDKGRVYAVAWMETINQQTRAYLAYSRHLNDPGADFAPGGTGADDYYSINKGDTANGLALGMQYVF